MIDPNIEAVWCSQQFPKELFLAMKLSQGKFD